MHRGTRPLPKFELFLLLIYRYVYKGVPGSGIYAKLHRYTCLKYFWTFKIKVVKIF